MVCRVEQWHRDSTGKAWKIGEVTRDCGIFTLDCPTNSPPYISSPNLIQEVCVLAGKNLKITYSTRDPDPYDSVYLKYQSNIPANIFSVTSGKWPGLTLNWTPGIKDIGQLPYNLLLTANDNSCPVPSRFQRKNLFYVIDSSQEVSIVKSTSGCALYTFQVKTNTPQKWTYLWLVDNKAVSTAQKFEYQFNTAASHYIHLAAQNKDCHCIRDIYDTLKLPYAPPVEAGKDTTICKGFSTQLSAWTAKTYSWSPSKGLSSTSVQNPMASPDTTTNYHLTITDNQGCTATDSVTVFVKDFTSYATPDTGICTDGGSVRLRAKGPAGCTYLWQPGNVKDSVLTVSPFKTTTYTVTISVPHVCTKKIPIRVGVSNIRYNADAGISKIICQGESVMLQAKGGKYYRWDKAPGINDLNISNPIVKPSSTQLYKVTVTDSFGCSAVDSVLIYVYPFNPAVAKPSSSICITDTLSVTASGGTAYLWDASPTLKNSTSATARVFPNIDTWYYVTIRDNVNGCSHRDSVLINVDRDCVWPGDLNRDGKADYLDFLQVGVGYGAKGPKRYPSYTKWAPFHSADWKKTTGNGVDYKFLDAFGDGSIDGLDTTAIISNYHRHHNKKLRKLYKNPNDPPMFFKLTKDTFYAGEWVNGELRLGSPAKNMDSVYGIGFSYTYPTQYVENNTFLQPHACDILCDKSGNLTFYRNYSGMIEDAVVMKSHIPSSGNGRLADLQFQLKDSTFSYNDSGEWVYIKFVDAMAVNEVGREIGIYPVDDSVFVRRYHKKPGINSLYFYEQPDFRIYPVPAENQVVIESAGLNIKRIRILNCLGRPVYQNSKPGRGKIVLDVAELSSGVYILSLENDAGRWERKIVISR